MFGRQPGVLDRHIPAAEVDHLGPVLAVDGVQSGLAEGGYGHLGASNTRIADL
jgi:hypothetical protein